MERNLDRRKIEEGELPIGQREGDEGAPGPVVEPSLGELDDASAGHSDILPEAGLEPEMEDETQAHAPPGDSPHRYYMGGGWLH